MEYVILHGSFGSNDGNWFPWLKQELQNRNKQGVAPQMPIGVGKQNFESWSNELDRLAIDENTIIIAHSIAPVFVCKYLIKNDINVKKLIFVCGFNNYLGINLDYDAVNEPKLRILAYFWRKNGIKIALYFCEGFNRHLQIMK